MPKDKLKNASGRKEELQAKLKALEGQVVQLQDKIEKAKRNAKKRKTDVGREKAADRVDVLVGQRKQALAQIDDVKADLGETNAQLRRLRRKLKIARQKRLARRRNWASENFRFDEFNCHEGGPVPSYMHDDLRDLCTRILEPMRAKFGPAHVNSGHRWEWYNQRIGGATGSYHEYEIRQDNPAADCTFAKGSPAEWASYARSLGIGGVGQYNASGFVHVDTGPRRDWSG